MKKIFTAFLLTLTMVGVSAVNKKPKFIKTSSGLQYAILEKGSGIKVHRGDTVKVHYTGRLQATDSVFDSSVKSGTPFEFPLSRARVIKGWDEGIALLKVGDKARLIIPPGIGYGDKDYGPIPANSTLVFDIEVLGTKPGIRPFEYKKKDTFKTASGVKYQIVKANPTGTKVTSDSKVKVNSIIYLSDGTIIDASADRGKPSTVMFGKNPNFKGFDEGLQLMRQGEKYRLFVPYQLAFGENGIKGLIPPKATIIYDIEVVSVEPQPKAVPFEIEGKHIDTTVSGLKYIVVKKGTGEHATFGKMVKVHYTGYLDNGKIFDSSIERDEPIEFPLGKGMVIPGWEEGIALMSVGDKIRLIIPYQLAYGVAGRPPLIPAKAQLTFDVELIDVK